jgi:hypothetical protein
VLELCARVVACCCLACSLGVVAWAAQPLQIGEAVVVALLDVVGVCAKPVACAYVYVRLAQTVRSGFDLAAKMRPVMG